MIPTGECFFINRAQGPMVFRKGVNPGAPPELRRDAPPEAILVESFPGNQYIFRHPDNPGLVLGRNPDQGLMITLVQFNPHNPEEHTWSVESLDPFTFMIHGGNPDEEQWWSAQDYYSGPINVGPHRDDERLKWEIVPK